jgi:hypothetical protein
MPLNCTGEDLPAGSTTINLPESPKSLDDFCIVLDIDDEILLYESLSNSRNKYWVIIQADDYPISICELEQYADYLSTQNQWQNRRADYLIIGSHNGDCYLIIVELRHVLVTETQEDDKFEQLRESIQQLVRNLDAINQSVALAGVYSNPEFYKLIGIVIAPGNTRRFSRGELNLIIPIDSHKALIRTLPKDALRDCRITWTDLLRRIGIPLNAGRASNPDFDIPAYPPINNEIDGITA